METLKYKVIKSERQYDQYVRKLEQLVFEPQQTKALRDEIDLLTLLVEKWDEEHNTFDEVDPIRLLHSLMEEHLMKSKDLVDLLQVSKGNVSDILNCKKGLSKEVIRKLSDHFKVAQEAFNRPYKLHVPENKRLRNASVMNTKKELELV